MKIDDMRVFNYYCGSCEEGFYLERLLSPNIITCPHCGESEDVCISSKHLKELNGDG